MSQAKAEQQETYEGEQSINSDPLNIVDRDNRNHRKKRELIDAVTAAGPGDSVLEVGCGDGVHATKWAERYDYLGVDLSKSLAARTRARGCNAFQADATDLPLPANHFNVVVGNAVLHHIPEPRSALREWIRVASGSVTITEPNYLFPKAFLETHTIPEERHKTMMAPWRIRRIVADVADERGWTWQVEPVIHTPPWPQRLEPVYDGIDAVFRRVPLAKWSGQMLRIQIER